MKAAGVRPNAVTYNTLLRGHRSHGEFYQVQRALAVYEEMREAGHVPNDFILQGLITEWAEGISTTSEPTLSDPGRGFLDYTEALVHKVAVHALGANDNLTIDLHGLSKGEARTAVLAVLRIIKERYSLGSPIQEDLIIITGMATGVRSEASLSSGTLFLVSCRKSWASVLCLFSLILQTGLLLQLLATMLMTQVLILLLLHHRLLLRLMGCHPLGLSVS